MRAVMKVMSTFGQGAPREVVLVTEDDRVLSGWRRGSHAVAEGITSFPILRFVVASAAATASLGAPRR